MTDDAAAEALTLERFLREVALLDAQQLLAISAAHRSVGREALEQAREAAAEIARSTSALDDLQALQGTIAQWIGAHNSRTRRYTMEGLIDDPFLIDCREQARPALLDAATALFLADRLAPDDRGALLGAVDSVIG